MPHAYPLTAKFKVFALSQTFLLDDASGARVHCVKQKAFRLKEDIAVYADEAQTDLRYTIKADRILDWSAAYAIQQADGTPVCQVRRKGARSIWKATYEVHVGGQLALVVHEKNPWTKVFDALLSEVPILGIFTGYFLHPVYAAETPDGKEILRATKQPAFLQGKFGIDRGQDFTDGLEAPALMGLCLTLLLERLRG